MEFQFSSTLRVQENELTARYLRPFYQSASALVDSGVRELVIDLSDVDYIDSASVGCLMDICKAMADQNGVVKLIGLQERVRMLAVLAGLTRFIGVPVEEGIALQNLEALATLRAKGNQR
jgi:anti-anti-sigma factor